MGGGGGGGGLKTLTGETNRYSDNYQFNVEEQRNFSNDLNRFCCRFERDDLDGELNRLMSQIEEGVRAGRSEDFETDAKTVESIFQRINSTKIMGQDNVSGRLLRHVLLNYVIFTAEFLTSP